MGAVMLETPADFSQWFLFSFFFFFGSFWLCLVILCCITHTEKIEFFFYFIELIESVEMIKIWKKKEIGISPFPYYEIKRKNKKQETECFLSDWVPTGGNKS
jgi:predicted membrane metal-binding protein